MKQQNRWLKQWLIIIMMIDSRTHIPQLVLDYITKYTIETTIVFLLIIFIFVKIQIWLELRAWRKLIKSHDKTNH